MQRNSKSAAIAAILCVSISTVGNAENKEIFAPRAGSVLFNDAVDSNKSASTGSGYDIVHGHAVIEGDMVLGRVDSQGNLLGSYKRGLGQARTLDRWPNGIVPYQFSAGISANEQDLAEQAVDHWNQYSSITLVELTDENRADYPNYVTFESSNGCASYVGMRGGEQELWISSSCGVGSIIHEIGHAVGLFHEHTRNDRDNFITVLWDNIVPGKEFNFDILNSNTVLLGEYDYGSIMHYGESFFSVGNQATINVLDGSDIGQRIALSDRDIQSANTLYETDLALTLSVTEDTEGDRLITDIQITNQGDMGAHRLKLLLDTGGDASWLSMSANSGWGCTSNGTLLTCNRDTLDASATSLFTVVANANGTPASITTGELLAKTRETDYTNNGHNKTVTPPPVPSAQGMIDGSGGNGSAQPINSSDTNDGNNSTQDPSDLGAANPDTEDPPADNTGNQPQSPDPTPEPEPTPEPTPDSEPAETGNPMAQVPAPDGESKEKDVASSASSGGAVSLPGSLVLFLMLTSAVRRRRAKPV